MKHPFISYPLAKLADEKQFNEPCMAFYDEYEELNCLDFYHPIRNSEMLKGFTVPLYQQIIDWLRDKEIRIIEKPAFGWDIYLEYNGGYISQSQHTTLDEAIKEAFKLI